MMKRRLLLSAMLSMAVLFNLTSCEDEEKTKEPSFEVFEYARVRCNGKTFPLSALQDTIIEANTFEISLNKYPYEHSVMYGVVGRQMIHKDYSSDIKLELDEPYEKYLLKLVARTDNENGGNANFTSDTLTISFYYVPKLYLSLQREFGEGENATTIKWEYIYKGEYLGHYSYTFNDQQNIYEKTGSDNSYLGSFDKYEKKSFEPSSEQQKNLEITVSILSDDIECNVMPKKIESNTNALTINDKELPAYREVYANISGQNVLLYHEAYKYKFIYNVKYHYGDRIIETTDSITSILVDKNSYAIDQELNIYRTQKIGDDVWTIDNYRGTGYFLHYKAINFECDYKARQYVISRPKSVEYDYDCFNFYDPVYNQVSSYENLDNSIPGYHVAKESDWQQLEKFFGITYTGHLIWQNEGTTVGRWLPAEDGIPSYVIKSILEMDYDEKKVGAFADNVPWSVFCPISENSSQEKSDFGFSFNLLYPGFHSGEAIGEAICFGRSRIFSTKYKSMCRYNDEGSLIGNVRYVKDKE